MDLLLLDIKNFLKKLETGQLEIEAGQWELHKDLTNMRETIDEMRKLKEDVEEMKLSNEEAMELIKRLESKLEAYKIALAENKPTVSESEEYEEHLTNTDDKQNNTKAFKKRKCHRIVSEKIVEITSDMDSNDAENEENDSADSEYVPKRVKKIEHTSKPYHKHKNWTESDHSYSRRKRKTRKPDGVIMQRYLSDAVKYRQRGSSNSSADKKPSGNDSICTSTIRPEPIHGAYWDDISRKKAYRSEQRAVDAEKVKNFNKLAQKESVLPIVFYCPRCPKSFAYKNELTRHEKYAHDNSKRQFYCRKCKNVFDQKCTLRDHVSLQFMKSKSKQSKEGVYKCSYCNNISTSPEELTEHLKRCRIISNAGLKGNE